MQAANANSCACTLLDPPPGESTGATVVVVSWVLFPRAATPGLPPPPPQAAATMATAPAAKVAWTALSRRALPGAPGAVAGPLRVIRAAKTIPSDNTLRPYRRAMRAASPSPRAPDLGKVFVAMNSPFRGGIIVTSGRSRRENRFLHAVVAVGSLTLLGGIGVLAAAGNAGAGPAPIDCDIYGGGRAAAVIGSGTATVTLDTDCTASVYYLAAYSVYVDNPDPSGISPSDYPQALSEVSADTNPVTSTISVDLPACWQIDLISGPESPAAPASLMWDPLAGGGSTGYQIPGFVWGELGGNCAPTTTTGTTGTTGTTATTGSTSTTATSTTTTTVPQPGAGTAPQITSANTTTCMVTVPCSFTVTTKGDPSVSSIAVAGALPTGVTFKDNGDGTGTLSGAPAGSSACSYPLVLRATNGVLPDASQNFTLIVKAPPAKVYLGPVRAADTPDKMSDRIPPRAATPVRVKVQGMFACSLPVVLSVVSTGGQGAATVDGGPAKQLTEDFDGWVQLVGTTQTANPNGGCDYHPNLDLTATQGGAQLTESKRLFAVSAIPDKVSEGLLTPIQTNQRLGMYASVDFQSDSGVLADLNCVTWAELVQGVEGTVGLTQANYLPVIAGPAMRNHDSHWTRAAVITPGYLNVVKQAHLFNDPRSSSSNI